MGLGANSKVTILDVLNDPSTVVRLLQFVNALRALLGGRSQTAFPMSRPIARIE